MIETAGHLTTNYQILPFRRLDDVHAVSETDPLLIDVVQGPQADLEVLPLADGLEDRAPFEHERDLLAHVEGDDVVVLSDGGCTSY